MASYTWITLLFLITYQDLGSCKTANYSVDDLKNRYPGYGTKWMYFPNGEGIPTIGYLEMPPADSAIFLSPEEVEESLVFRLYTRTADYNGTILSAAGGNYSTMGYNINKDTKVVTHGWLSSGRSDTCLNIKDAYLLQGDINVIILDWSKIADNIFYPIPMAYTKTVGNCYARFLDHLVENGARMSNIHLIGHSLGAHVSGFAGRAVSRGKVERITALDPALPGFTHGFRVDHLLPSDANFVDVIHTCGGVLGVMQSLGHADFYPNGGMPPQPGCFGVAEIIEACSHGRSWQYFAESIASKQMFVAKRCRSWGDYLVRSCDNDSIPMGNPTPMTAKGLYYLETESNSPFVKTTLAKIRNRTRKPKPKDRQL